MRKLARQAVVLVACAGLTATGCGGSSHVGGGARKGSTPTTTTAATSASGGGSTTSAPTATGGGTSKPIVAPQETSNPDGDQVQAAITQLKRQNSLMVLSFTVTVVTMAPNHNSWQVAEFFSSLGAGHDLADSTHGIYLLDSSNQKKYLVAVDSQGSCACSTNLSGTFLTAGKSTSLTATFAAPPANITSIDVNVPHFGAFLNVPISG